MGQRRLSHLIVRNQLLQRAFISAFNKVNPQNGAILKLHPRTQPTKGARDPFLKKIPAFISPDLESAQS